MKDNCIKDIEQSLKGLRNSKNRNIVISILLEESIPLSVEDIFNRVKIYNDKVSLSTIYRIMDKLLSLNIVRKAAMYDDKTLYEIVKDKHHHYIICTKCKKMAVIDNCPVSELEKKISEDTGFVITGHKYEIYGECKECHNHTRK